MDLHISLTDGVPIYQQIVTQIRYLVAAGRLSPGFEMPPIRSLAEELQINPNTVARAYRELEREGMVEKRSTKGTYVAENATRLTARHRQSAINERIDQLLAESYQLGFSFEQLLNLIHTRSKVMDRNHKTQNRKSDRSEKSA